MKINFLSSKTYLGSKTKEAKIRKLSISKDRIMTVSVDNLKWMGIEDAVLIGMEEGAEFRGVLDSNLYIAPSKVEDERSFLVNKLGVKYRCIYLRDVLSSLGWDIGDNQYAVYDIVKIKDEDGVFCLVPREIKKNKFEKGE